VHWRYYPEQGVETEAAINKTGGEGLFLECDVRRISDFEKVKDRLVKDWGGVDVVVNNAGVASAGSIEDTTIADWEWILDINVMGVVRGCKVFTPVLKEQGSGTIVNIASMAGLMLAPLMNSYNVSQGWRDRAVRDHEPRVHRHGRECLRGLPGLLPDQPHQLHALEHSWHPEERG